MAGTRSRKQTIRYHKHLKKLAKRPDCVLCAIAPNSPQFVSQTKHFMVARNTFPYSLWDEHSVVDHLMLIPRAHTDTLSSLPPSAAQEFFDIIRHYEQRGYNVFARAPGQGTKSVAHQHTHLIKSGKKRKRFMAASRKPYFRFSF